MTVNLDWDGVDKFAKALGALGKVASTDMAGGLFEEAEMIMGQSKRDTPVDTGRLRSSGTVQPPKIRATSAEVALTYGTDYAVYVHEIRGLNHPVGKAKFLEDAINRAARGIDRRLGLRVKRRWKMRWGNAVR